MKKVTNHYLEILGIKFTIKEKFSRWHIAFSHNGKRISRSTGLVANKQNLETVKGEVLLQVAQELNAKTSTQCVLNNDELLENFATIHLNLLSENIRPHVYKRVKANYNNHILPYFKGRKLKSIKPMELEEWQNRLQSKYKPLSVQKYRSIFYSIFTRAYQNEMVTKNPFDLVTAPKVKSTFSMEANEPINPFTQKEINTLIADEDGTYMPNFIKFMANTGMRPGEIIALKWSDINFENLSINVNKTIVNGKEGLPKTRSSVRKVDILDGAYEALKAQYTLTSNFEHVFVNSSNKRFYSHDIINVNLQKRLVKHNIEARSIYQIRHSFTSHAIKNNIDITWVSAMLGHKDSAITLKIYTKFIQEDAQTRMKNLNKINTVLSTEI